MLTLKSNMRPGRLCMKLVLHAIVPSCDFDSLQKLFLGATFHYEIDLVHSGLAGVSCSCCFFHFVQWSFLDLSRSLLISLDLF